MGEGGVWVLNADDRTVMKINPDREAVVRTTGVPGVFTSDPYHGATFRPPFTAGEGGVWLGQRRTLLKLDPSSYNAPATSIRLPDGTGADRLPLVVQGVAVGARSLWIAHWFGVTRLDAVSGSLLGRIDAPFNPSLIAFGDGAVWVIGDGLARIDPGTNAAVPVLDTFASRVHALAVDTEGVWVSAAGVLYRLDPGGTSVGAVIPIGKTLSGVAVEKTGVWAASYGDSAVYRVDPKTNQVVAKIPLAAPPDAVAVGYGRIWVTVY